MASEPRPPSIPDLEPVSRSEPTLTTLPLVRKNRLLSFERRIKLWLAAAGVLITIPTAILIQQQTASLLETLGTTVALALVYALLADIFFDQLLRPLQTLANIISAIREEDYSFRARGARRGDTVGDLALEINSLSGALQTQRAAAQDALSLLERVLSSMQSPVLAFDAEQRLRLLNTAAREAFVITQPSPIGLTAAELSLTPLLDLPDQGLYPPTPADAFTSTPIRWSVRRSTFRLNGFPHTLLVLSNVAAALREEERLAWQRLIRVLSHEINNSLTPIHSIAGSLRKLTGAFDPDDLPDYTRGLTVIEERAASLNRFLQAYQRLTHLPPPGLVPTSVAELVHRTVLLETRLAITVQPGPAITLPLDPDQIQQALINLLQNAADAALSPEAVTPGRIPAVTFTWSATATELRLAIRDNGLGIDNPANLFVPFYTTKASGSGIGLVLAQQIVTAHRGSINLRSASEPRGCTATLTLPLVQPVTP